MPNLQNRHWAMYLRQQARARLRRRFIRPLNHEPLVDLFNIVREAALDAGDQSLYEELERTGIWSLVDSDEWPQFVQDLDDMLNDSALFDAIQVIDEMIGKCVGPGEIWTCDLTGSNLTFTYCCNRRVVESAIVASGGSFAKFIQNLIG